MITPEEAVGLLREMVRIPSTSFHEEAVSSHILSFLRNHDIEAGEEKLNIIARNRLYDSRKPTLMLCAHMDTVEPASDYTFDPYNPPYSEDTVYGLGSNDDSGCVVSLISAFSRFYDDEMPLNLLLVLTVEEERSGADGMRGLWPLPADWAIIGEPTGMRAATSERGLLVLDGTAEGVSGHAARSEGVNALYIALDDIAALRSHVFEKVSPVMGKVHLNVTQIAAGEAHNVIPDRCTFVVDIRPTECYTGEEILSELQAECRSTLKARNLGNRSSATPPGSPLYATVEALGLPTFSSPTSSDWMRISCPGVKIGPGDSARSHHADEFIRTAEIEEAIETYTELIRELMNHI